MGITNSTQYLHYFHVLLVLLYFMKMPHNTNNTYTLKETNSKTPTNSPTKHTYYALFGQIFCH